MQIICPHSRQIKMPAVAPHHSVFTRQMPFLPPNQQRQSIEKYHILANSFYIFWGMRFRKVSNSYHAALVSRWYIQPVWHQLVTDRHTAKAHKALVQHHILKSIISTLTTCGQLQKNCWNFPLFYLQITKEFTLSLASWFLPNTANF